MPGPGPEDAEGEGGGGVREPPAGEAGSSPCAGAVLLFVAPGWHLHRRSPGSEGPFVCVRSSPVGGRGGFLAGGFASSRLSVSTEPEAPGDTLGGPVGAVTSPPWVQMDPSDCGASQPPDPGPDTPVPANQAGFAPQVESACGCSPPCDAAASAPGPRGCGGPPRAPCCRSPKAVRSSRAGLARGNTGEAPTAWEEGGRLPWPGLRAPAGSCPFGSHPTGPRQPAPTAAASFHSERSVSCGQTCVRSPAGAHGSTLTFVPFSVGREGHFEEVSV